MRARSAWSTTFSPPVRIETGSPGISLTATKVIVAAPQSTAKITPRCCMAQRAGLEAKLEAGSWSKAGIIEIWLCVRAPTDAVKMLRGCEPVGSHVERYHVGLADDLPLHLNIKPLARLRRGADGFAQFPVEAVDPRGIGSLRRNIGRVERDSQNVRLGAHKKEGCYIVLLGRHAGYTAPHIHGIEVKSEGSLL